MDLIERHKHPCKGRLQVFHEESQTVSLRGMGGYTFGFKTISD
jgi:hypothetical protein